MSCVAISVRGNVRELGAEKVDVYSVISLEIPLHQFCWQRGHSCLFNWYRIKKYDCASVPSEPDGIALKF